MGSAYPVIIFQPKSLILSENFDKNPQIPECGWVSEELCMLNIAEMVKNRVYVLLYFDSVI